MPQTVTMLTVLVLFFWHQTLVELFMNFMWQHTIRTWVEDTPLPLRNMSAHENNFIINFMQLLKGNM
jgi:hypothetical protein